MEVLCVLFAIQTTEINEFGFSWAVNKQDCERHPEEPDNPCETDAYLAMDITTTCSLFDPMHNEGETIHDGLLNKIILAPIINTLAPISPKILSSFLTLAYFYAGSFVINGLMNTSLLALRLPWALMGFLYSKCRNKNDLHIEK